MIVLVNGAAGLIGSAVCARLASEGHTVVGVARNPPATTGVVSRWIRLDMAEATTLDAWVPHLREVEAVVNCAGVLQDSPREDTATVHNSGADVLFAACERLQIRRVIHFSAIGVDRHQASAFSTSKHQGDMALKQRDLDWVILRPSVVLGRPVFGASALFRGLAALPVVPIMGGTGKLQVVMLDDVAATVAFFVDRTAPARVELELAGPERLDMSEIVARYRNWLGWRPARPLRIPQWLGTIVYRLGDLVGVLGWRPPMRSTARQEIVHGAVGDSSRWTEMTGLVPQSLDAFLSAQPAGVQERWFASLYFLKPIVFAILASFWVLTGIISLTTGFSAGVGLMAEAQTNWPPGPAVVAGAVADILVGLAIAYRPTAKSGLWAAIGLSCFYIVAGTVLLPELWRQPLGPLLKIWPILATHFLALAILRER